MMKNQKVCSACKKNKCFSEFSKGNASYNLSSWCKECWKLYRLKHPDIRPEYKHLQYLRNKQQFPWINSYKNAEQRCNNPKSKDFKHYGGRGIKFLLTKKECEILWNRDKGWLLNNPSIDRKNNEQHYNFANSQFIEFNENALKNTLTMPRNSKGVFIKRVRR